METAALPKVLPRADGILMSWLRGAKTYVQAVRELVALGYTRDEADAVLAAAKVAQ